MIGWIWREIAQDSMQEVQSIRNPLAPDGSPATSSAEMTKLPWQCLAAKENELRSWYEKESSAASVQMKTLEYSFIPNSLCSSQDGI